MRQILLMNWIHFLVHLLSNVFISISLVIVTQRQLKKKTPTMIRKQQAHNLAVKKIK